MGERSGGRWVKRKGAGAWSGDRAWWNPPAVPGVTAGWNVRARARCQGQRVSLARRALLTVTSCVWNQSLILQEATQGAPAVYMGGRRSMTNEVEENTNSGEHEGASGIFLPSLKTMMRIGAGAERDDPTFCGLCGNMCRCVWLVVVKSLRRQVVMVRDAEDGSWPRATCAPSHVRGSKWFGVELPHPL